MKLSIIVSILNSHEIVRRHLLYFERIGVPDDVEILYMDDGSNPPLSFPDCKLKNLRIIPTGIPQFADGKFIDGRVGRARNMGARLAQGEYLLMTDIDYIIPRDAIEAGRNLTYDKQGFRRQFGVLDENGNLTQDFDVLRSYGLLGKRIQERGTLIAPHPNNFIMRKSTFFAIGGYREDRIGWNYPDGHDRWFKRDWTRYYDSGKATLSPERTTLYMYPTGQFCGDVDYNPFGLFHKLSRKNETWPRPEKSA